MRPIRTTSRKLGGAHFHTRVFTPRIGTSSISSFEPGAVRSAWAWATVMAGQPGLGV
jgi:hypothetical protein